MRLSDLLPHLAALRVDGPTDRGVTHVTHDSRQARPDGIYVAIRGSRVDGRRFTPTLNVAVVICDGPVTVLPDVTVVTVENPRRAMAAAASAICGHPAQHMPVVGITGTNGKTTTCWMLEQIGLTAGMCPGIIGTTGHRVGGQPLPPSPLTAFTTPESPVLQQLLQEMRSQGSDFVAMEASSIGLHANRTDHIPFKAALFTSFSRDHLDYHGTQDAYLQAKQRLFTTLVDPSGVSVLYGDDPHISTTPCRTARVWRYSTQDPSADIFAGDVRMSLAGIEAHVRTPVGTGQLRLQLVGKHNLENALAALGAALAIGIELDVALNGLHQLAHIAGRLERVPDPRGGRHIFVDYAHTPDALTQVLVTLRSLNPRQIVTVFGCGGDRDPGKRSMMGTAACDGSDRVVVTSDNPRSEDPQAIINDILNGVSGDVCVEADRASAIAVAIGQTQRGDIVLIAGKGHETTQTIGDAVLPFSDAAVAQSILNQGGRA